MSKPNDRTPEYCLDYELHSYEHFMDGGECKICGTALQDYFVWEAGMWSTEVDNPIDAEDNGTSTLSRPVRTLNVARPRLGRVERFFG